MIKTEVILSIMETYVDGLPIPSSSSLFINDVEEYLFGGFVNFSSFLQLTMSTRSPLDKLGNSCDFSVAFLIKSL